MARLAVSFSDPAQTYDLTLEAPFTTRRFAADNIVLHSLLAINQHDQLLKIALVDWDVPPGPNRLLIQLQDGRTATYTYTVRGNPRSQHASRYGLTLSGGDWTESEAETVEALKDSLLSLNATYQVISLRWRAR